MGLTIIDAKGRRRNVYSPLADALLPPFIPSLDPLTRQSIRQDAYVLGNFGLVDGAREIRSRMVTMGVLGAIGAAVAYLLFGPIGSIVVGTFAAFPVGLDAMRLRHSFYPAQPLACVAAMIRHRRCPSCAHAMLAPEDGSSMMKCTECGAHWNEDIGEWLLTGGGMERYAGGVEDED